MIIKQYLDVISGAKTQTRRLKDRYQVGKVYSVVPKMYKPSVWWRFYDGKFDVALDVIEHRPTSNGYHSETDYHSTTRIDHRESYSERGFIPLQIRITAKRTECLHDISEADAIAEGITFEKQMIEGYACRYLNPHKLFPTAKECYFDLWATINKKPGTRVEDNPLIVAYTFELVR